MFSVSTIIINIKDSLFEQSSKGSTGKMSISFNVLLGQNLVKRWLVSFGWVTPSLWKRPRTKYLLI